jgi:hypothetical protein
MKLKSKYKIEKFIKTLKVQHNDLHINYCGNNPIDIEKYFSVDDNLKSFPPNGKLEATELDYFYYIFHNNSVVGFYRVTDLFFKDIIELHGSFNKHDTFLIKSYFELTKLFVSTFFILFPTKKIQTTVHLSNTSVIKFLKYLNFIRIGVDSKKKDFIIFEKPLDMKVKIIKNQPKSDSYVTDKYIYLEDGESKFDYEDKCFLENKSYDKNRRIIRITNIYEENNRKKTKSIYRKAICGNRDLKLGTTKKNEIGLLRKDIILLNIKQTDNANLKVSNDLFCFFAFYIYNPNYATRISLISLLLGLLSVVLAILSFL